MVIEGTLAQSRGDKDFDGLEFPNAPIANEFASEAEAAVTALLRSSLEDDFVVANRFNHVLALVDRQSERLFTVNVLFGFGGSYVYERMPMVGRAVDDDIDIFAIEDFSEIRFGHGRRAVFGVARGNVLGVPFLHIANGDDVSEAGGSLEISRALAAAANQRDAWTIVCGGRFGIALIGGASQFAFHEPERQTGGGCRGRAVANE
jgi:hypothetical protein